MERKSYAKAYEWDQKRSAEARVEEEVIGAIATGLRQKERDVATEKVKVGRTLRNSSLNGWIMDFVKPFEKTRTEYYLQRNWDQYFSHWSINLGSVEWK